MGLAGTRLSFKHNAFYYRHRDGRWERMGTDVRAAKERAAIYNSPADNYGTTAYWLDQFLVDCQQRVSIKDPRRGLSPTTPKTPSRSKCSLGPCSLSTLSPTMSKPIWTQALRLSVQCAPIGKKACLRTVPVLADPHKQVPRPQDQPVYAKAARARTRRKSAIGMSPIRSIRRSMPWPGPRCAC